MPRFTVPLSKLRSAPSTTLQHTRFLATTRAVSISNSSSKQASEPATKEDKSGTSAQDSTPGWSGREGRDHAVNRPAQDQGAKSAQQGMKDHEQGKEGSDAISRKDERNSHAKAKEEFPEAPVTIGMNDERGSKGK